MVKFGKFITKHKLFILILGVLLIIPSMIGMVKTRVNYDVLSYLPDSLETVSGQDIMVDEFGMGAFSMVIVENMDNKDVVALKEKLEKVDHVEKIIWYDSVADISLPTDMLPNELKEALFNGDATMIDRMNHILSMKVFVARIIRMDSYSCIAQHSLQTSSSHHNLLIYQSFIQVTQTGILNRISKFCETTKLIEIITMTRNLTQCAPFHINVLNLYE